MSTWKEIKAEDVEIDEKSNELNICIRNDELVVGDFGANYITISLDVLKEKLNKPTKQKIRSNSICDYCIEGGFCGKKPSLECFVGIKIKKVR